MNYKITENERDYIQGLYFDKTAKQELVLMCLREGHKYDVNPYFDRVYDESIRATVAFSTAFDSIVSKYVPADIDTTNARIDFVSCSIVLAK